ncbi:GDSL-type esterase/lipase family protein [Rossellomorea aquimaris]|uniref:GDSL-type esterase/lipase family protein n=1 Tax=Rossellomorea aquimaris TaxID=189382 RepID=UPI001CD59BCB|nr:GDSL-type esterase/lipase family protein [Rossellomorea aquimaris]MCA1055391.1 GDSL-type esterase/lipase family protein [Rossellomorea aquimaris]
MTKWKMMITIMIIALIPVMYFNFFAEESKSQSQKRVIALGDSLTYGYGDKEDEGYIGRLEQKVNEKETEESYRFQNLGIPGQKSSGLQKQLLKPSVAEDLTEADLFIVNIGTNDLIKSNGGDLVPLHHDKIMEAKKEYVDHFNFILDTLEATNEDADILVIGLYNPYPDRDSDEIEAYVDDWNQTIMNEVKKHGNVKYVSTNPLFKGKKKESVFHDSLHPNGKGYEIMAKQIMKTYSF